MYITVKITGQNDWYEKRFGVVLVPTEADIDPLYNALVEQDPDWERYKHLIRVAPTEINCLTDLNTLCEYTSKTCIFDIPKLREKFDFLLYQYED